MDKIWDRKSKSEVIHRCDGDEKTEWPQQNIWMVKTSLTLLFWKPSLNVYRAHILAKETHTKWT